MIYLFNVIFLNDERSLGFALWYMDTHDYLLYFD